jgi:hypothetical protein
LLPFLQPVKSKKVTKSVTNYLNLRVRAQEPRERTHRCIRSCSASERRVSVLCSWDRSRAAARRFPDPDIFARPLWRPVIQPTHANAAATTRLAHRLYSAPPPQRVRASPGGYYRVPIRQVDRARGGGRSTSSLAYFLDSFASAALYAS